MHVLVCIHMQCYTALPPCIYDSKYCFCSALTRLEYGTEVFLSVVGKRLNERSEPN